ncbi:MAG: nucleotide exchange factor GrpE, partial [Porphyromonadaceae bacterium]|nr:nucleotide exchange factor GrpE [Porphyromonadaceae bacterium]
LSRQGVKAIETEGAAFDDELHEAIALLPAASEEQKGKIMDCVKKGYKLHDKVLRHASVVVGQ